MSAKDQEKVEQQGLLEFFKLTSKLNTGNMICVDFNGKEYNSSEEIMEDFYPMRLVYYQKRKVCELCHLAENSQKSDRLCIAGLPCE